MKWLERLKDRGKGLTDTVARYPLTMVFLAAAAILFAAMIQGESGEKLTKYLLTCAVGAVLGAALQAMYERFFAGVGARAGLCAAGVLLTAGYWLLIHNAPVFGTEIGVRTSVALFALLIGFIWVPVIRSEITFNESFMILFKALFLAAFYSGVLMGGCALILAATDRLIVPVDSDLYSYTADVVFVLFAPVYFLSRIPSYPGKRDEAGEASENRSAAIAKAAFCPPFLEVLISYIIIPLTAVFTLILVVYIALNIRGEFWTNNLLEPMLVAYAITVILVYILASRLENKFAVLFRRIFPKVLIPIVLFQIASSLLSIRDTGITHTRYYVILFGIFAALSGVVMSICPVRKNGLIAVLLIVFSAISILPPVDAFTVSRLSQTRLLETVLSENGMLKGDAVIPNPDVPNGDKEKIASSASYLSRMGYAGRVSFLPEDFNYYADAYKIFGFIDADYPSTEVRSRSVFLDFAEPIDISGYELLSRLYIGRGDSETVDIASPATGLTYHLFKENAGDYMDLVLKDEAGRELLRFHTKEIFDRYRAYETEHSVLGGEEASFPAETDFARAKIVVQSANFDLGTDTPYYSAELYVLIGIK